MTQEFSVKDMLEISSMSNAVLDELLMEVREYIGFLYKLSETLSTLDMLTSLATVSMSHDKQCCALVFSLGQTPASSIKLNDEE